MSAPHDVTINITLDLNAKGKMIITNPTCDSSAEVWNGKNVDFTIDYDDRFPAATILAIEFVDESGTPTLNQNGPFDSPPVLYLTTGERRGTVQADLDEASWTYRIWVYSENHVATHDPVLINRKG
jgi:hypothetical protein